MPRATFSQIVNRSMAEVLSRSLATSLCTLLPVLSLLFFGGETLKDFAFALLVGIASGAYSSIFIASPVLTEWKEREPIFRRRRQLVMEDHGGVVPAYAVAQLGEEELAADGTKRRTGRRVIAERPGSTRRETRPAAPQRMAGPMAPEIEQVEEEEEAQTVAEEPVEMNGGNGDDAEARRAERRRQQRAKRKHGRR
jgi:SecD/SecF fusion protein